MSDSATPWTTAHEAPPFMGFSRQEDWSGVPLPSPLLPIEELKYMQQIVIYVPEGEIRTLALLFLD